MALVTDQQNFVTLISEPDYFAMNFGYQRARGIDGSLVSGLGSLDYGWSDSVSGEHHHATLRGFVNLVNKDCPSCLERLNHMLVVDYLLADIDRGAVVVQSLLNCNDGSVNSRAVTSGGG